MPEILASIVPPPVLSITNWSKPSPPTLGTEIMAFSNPTNAILKTPFIFIFLLG